MLTFLRKIRKSLIESGSARKYILYAIGEIMLVMIGILLALQVNNWNEWRKDRIKERKVLQQLVKTIESNSEHFKNLGNMMHRANESIEAVISIIETKRPYDESMNNLFHSVRVRTSLALNTSGYEELKNVGFDLIKSDSLKEDVIKLFESTYSITEKVFTDVDVTDDNIRNFIIENFLQIDPYALKPIHYDDVINSQYYYSSLLHMRNIRSWRNDMVDTSLLENQRVLQLIKDELQGADIRQSADRE